MSVWMELHICRKLTRSFKNRIFDTDIRKCLSLERMCSDRLAVVVIETVRFILIQQILRYCYEEIQTDAKGYNSGEHGHTIQVLIDASNSLKHKKLFSWSKLECLLLLYNLKGKQNHSNFKTVTIIAAYLSIYSLQYCYFSFVQTP